MINTNISKKRFAVAQMVPLDAEERDALANATIGHGNMTKVVGIVGVSDVTIRRAIAGFRLTPPVHAALRGFLSTLSTPKSASHEPA